ncbi:hypothetical protein ETB97_001924 [Aspergillus alliaceus]|uniref:Uncharacterized protein n=1 Tax=Petromyces alliaceus TaxID=209559 RepID=A0A8H6AEP5_PETAA|nr:hypothetical protein ETB97_001924 [Aspergillus burnettii]
MAWTVALEGWTRLQARQSLDHHAYESINEALVIFGLVTGTLALFVHTYTSVFITRQFGVHNGDPSNHRDLHSTGVCRKAESDHAILSTEPACKAMADMRVRNRDYHCDTYAHISIPLSIRLSTGCEGMERDNRWRALCGPAQYHASKLRAQCHYGFLDDNRSNPFDLETEHENLAENRSDIDVLLRWHSLSTTCFMNQIIHIIWQFQFYGRSESSGAPTSGTRNTRQHGRSRYFDDDIELIQNGSNASRSMVITRTVEMELQYHKNEVDVKPMKQPGP